VVHTADADYDYCPTSIAGVPGFVSSNNFNPVYPSSGDLTGFKVVVQYKFEPTDPLALNAMNSELQALYTGTTNGFFANVNYYASAQKLRRVDNIWETMCCDTPVWCSTPGHYSIGVGLPNAEGYADDDFCFQGLGLENDPNAYDYDTCQVLTGGTMDCGQAPNADLLWYNSTCIGGGGIGISVSVLDTNMPIIVVPKV
jgi:hypothetical protein